MKTFRQSMSAVWHFYRDSFRNMTWGRPLVWLILLKVFILSPSCASSSSSPPWPA